MAPPSSTTDSGSSAVGRLPVGAGVQVGQGDQSGAVPCALSTVASPHLTSRTHTLTRPCHPPTQAILEREEDAGALLELIAVPGVLSAFDRVNCATFIHRCVRAAVWSVPPQQARGRSRGAPHRYVPHRCASPYIPPSTYQLPPCILLSFLQTRSHPRLSKAVANQRRHHHHHHHHDQRRRNDDDDGDNLRSRLEMGVELVLERTTALLPQCDARQVGEYVTITKPTQDTSFNSPFPPFLLPNTQHTSQHTSKQTHSWPT